MYKICRRSSSNESACITFIPCDRLNRKCDTCLWIIKYQSACYYRSNKKFEKELLLTLLKPQGRGIALTDAGEELAILAKRLFAVEQQIEQFALDYRNGTNGCIRLAATYLPAHFLIPTWIAKFKQQYEQVEMIITTTNSSDALKQLLHVDVDMAIYGGYLKNMWMRFRPRNCFRTSYGLLLHRITDMPISK